jgi:hypothetical protein
VVANPTVEAAFAARLRNDDPQADAMREQRGKALGVAHRRQVLADHFTDQMPEPIDVLVILTSGKAPATPAIPPFVSLRWEPRQERTFDISC